MTTPTRRSALQELIEIGGRRSSPLTVMTTFPDNILNDSFIDSPNTSLSRSFNSPAPSPDEMIIRQRGRRSISVNFSPPKTNGINNNNSKTVNHNNLVPKTPKSPLKTPTKNAGQQMQMILRSSPRKRLLMASEALQAGLNGSMEKRQASPTKLLEGTKKLRINNEKSFAQQDIKTPLAIYLKGYTSEQLIDLILNKLVKDDPFIECELRMDLPSPDIRPMEQQLIHLKKNIYRSLPSSRLVKKTDSVGFSRASLHLIAFKSAIVEHLTKLSESRHFDAVIDYILMAWQYVKGTPIWENLSHNSTRKHSFKIMAFHAKSALQEAGLKLGEERLRLFHNRLWEMQADCETISSCTSQLDYLLKAIESKF